MDDMTVEVNALFVSGFYIMHYSFMLHW